MKKLFIVMLLLAACSSAPEATPSSSMPVPGADVDETVVEKADDSLFSDIGALFKSGTAAKCVMKAEGSTVTMYINGQNQRMDMMGPNGEASTINDGTWMYVWSGASGVKMSLETIKQLSGDAGQNYQTPEDVASTSVDIKCSPAVVAGSMFLPPANVQFQDMSAMMQQIQDMQQ
mgnify:CR=1 FL=1